MQFRQCDRAAIGDGSMTMTIRRWRSPQAVAGHRYRTAAGMIEVDTVAVIATGDISDADAVACGHASAEALRTQMGGDPALPIYRVTFHAVKGPDPRDALAAASLDGVSQAELGRRLERLDAASANGPWTADTLALIAENPGVRAADLATRLGRERLDFKADVRKLKALGLTISLTTGYELSPRGKAWLEVDGAVS